MKLLVIAGLAAISATFSGAAAVSPVLDRQFNETVRPFVTKYCVGCHSGEMPAAALDLKSYSSMDAVIRDYSRWTVVKDKLEAKQMPPKPMPAPPAETAQKVISWIQAVRLDET